MLKANKDWLIFNVSDNKANYSQRNNEYKWYGNGDAKVTASTMCNLTSMCMAADYMGYNFPDGKYDQPEDNAADFTMKSPEVDAYYKAKMPAMYADYKAGKEGCYTPNEIHAVLSYAMNLWMGCQMTQFIDNMPIKDMLTKLTYDNEPMVISGKFDKLSHIVVLVGAIYKNNLGTVNPTLEQAYESIKINKPLYMIYDDPWGCTYNYADTTKKGNDVIIPYKKFISDIKPFNNETIKWAHTFNKPAATI